MKRTMTRRTVCTTGAAALGMSGAALSRAAGEPVKSGGTGSGGVPATGTTPIRLGTALRRRDGESVTGMVRRIRQGGHASVWSNEWEWKAIGDDEVDELDAALRDHDLTLFEYGGYVNLIHPDSATRRKNLAYLAESMERAERVGCLMVGTIAGSRDPEHFFNVHPDNWTMETWRVLVASCRQVLRDTAGMKVALGMEAQVTTTIDGPLAHKRLIEDVGDERCAVCLDPVNMMCLERYYHSTELLHECFDLLGERILGCHAKDACIWPDRQTVHVQEVPSGRGVMDYDTYLALMSRMQWARTLQPDHIPDDQIPEAESFYRTVADRVGVTFHT